MTTTTNTPPTNAGRDQFYDRLTKQPLRRPTQGRWVSGVMASVANHFDIDPLLIRVGSIVAAVCLGLDIPGLSLIAVYLWATLFIPKDDGTLRIRHAMEDRDTSSILMLIGAAVATLVLVFVPHLALLGACFAGALLWVAYRSNPAGQATTQDAAAVPFGPATAPASTSTSTMTLPAGAPPVPPMGGPTPPVGPPPPPQHQRAPRPAQPPRPPRPRRLGTPGSVVLATWGAAILAAAGWYLTHRDAELTTQLIPTVSLLAGIPAAVGIIAAGLGRRVWALALSSLLALSVGFGGILGVGSNRYFGRPSTQYVELTATSLPNLTYNLTWKNFQLDVPDAAFTVPHTVTMDLRMSHASIYLPNASVPTRININYTSTGVDNYADGFTETATTRRGPKTSTSFVNYTGATMPIVTINIDASLSSVTFQSVGTITTPSPTPSITKPATAPAKPVAPTTTSAP